MNITQGNIFWSERVGIVKKYPYLSENTKCDVLVVGGGITGALTAYVQAKQGFKVIVVDKNIIGYGSTLCTDGTMASRVDFNNKIVKGTDEKTISKCNNLCKEAMEDLKNIVEEISSDEDIKKYIEFLGFKNVDLMYYSDKITNKIGMYKMFEKIGKQNSSIEYLEEDPVINLRTGIVFPSDAIVTNPYLLTHVIFMYLAKMPNVEIFENTKVIDITSKDEETESITNNKFKIHSKTVILTNGIHALNYLKEGNITVNKTFTLVTEKVDSLDQNVTNLVAKDINFPNTTISFTKDKRIVLSGEDIKENERSFNQKFADGKYKKMFLNYRRLLNVPEDIKITNCFYGVYLDTKDGLPIIDEIRDMPNVYLNLGTGKNGIIFSMIGAKMLKEIVVNYNVKDMYLFRENRDK